MCIKKIIYKIKNVIYINSLSKKTSSILNNSLLNNTTKLGGYNKLLFCDLRSSTIGFGTYASFCDLSNGIVGKFCSIGKNLRVIVGKHPTEFVSTFPGFYNTKNTGIFKTATHISFKEENTLSNGKSFCVGNDVWIGDNVTIMGGVTIGDGAIIGANALITKDVQPYSIVGGVPAKLIRYRFDKDTILQLLEIKWWDWPLERIETESDKFNNVNTFLQTNKN